MGSIIMLKNEITQDLKSVLIVDDEPSLRQILRFEFELMGFRVLTAENGNAAFNILTHDPVQLVVTDIRMAGGDGIDLLKKMSDFIQRPIFIVMTGDPDFHSKDLMGLGADAVVAKPFDWETITTVLKSKRLVA